MSDSFYIKNKVLTIPIKIDIKNGKKNPKFPEKWNSISTVEEAIDVFSKYRTYKNLALLTGKINNITILDIDDEENMELYLAYKQKKMVRSVPVIFAYVSNPERDKSHWWAPDFSVNSAQTHDLDTFFGKVTAMTK